MKGVIKLVPNKKLDHDLKDIANGNKEALSHFYSETKTAVYGYILSILKNKSLAEDVLQDTYIKIWENAYLYQSKEKPMAWVFTIAKNASLMKIRKEKKHSDIEDLNSVIDTSQVNIDDRLFLSYLFENVSEEERNIVILHAVSGFRYREIAKMLNIPLGTILSKYNRTIKKIKEIAKKEEKNDEA